MWFALYGSICGIQFVTNGILLADIFGRKALGSINGMAIAVSTASSGLGPLMFGACKDYMGSYRPILVFEFCLLSTVGFLLTITPLPQRTRDTMTRANRT